MERLKQLVVRRGVDELIPLLDSRRGAVLFVGAELPEVALHVLRLGVFVTVVESDATRVDAFMDPLKTASLDVGVTVDRRPYSEIEFLASSYNAIIAWNGIPPETPVELFFKKTRHDLKAGGALFLRLSLRPDFVGLVPALTPFTQRLPAPLGAFASKALGGLSRLAGQKLEFGEAPRPDRESRPASPQLPGTGPAHVKGARGELGAMDRASVLEAASRHYNIEKTFPLSVLVERVALSPIAGAMDVLPDVVYSLLARVDRRLSSGPAGRLATSTLFHFTKTKEFGRVFRVP